jgi:hypothetical protein
MERPSVAVESVSHLQESDRRALEGILGQQLRENQQVFIMVLSPGTEPDEAARTRARAGLDATFAKTAAYADEHGVTDDAVDVALEEARRHVRPRKD